MTRKRIFFDPQNDDCAPATQTRIADLDNRFCREIEKSFCAGKVYPNSHESDSGFVIPTIRGECSTQFNCSQKCHTFKQKIILSCRVV